MKRTSPAACSALLILPERAERDPAILQFTRHFTHVADFGTRAHVYADVQGQLVPSLQALRANLRALAQGTSLFDGALFAEQVTSTLEQVWQAHIKHEPD